MAIKDKVKRAAQALKKDEPKAAPASTSTSTPTPTPAPAPAAATAAPTSTKPGAALATKTTAPPTSIQLPKSNGQHTSTNSNSNGIKTPKTPQDEAIAFFSSGADGQPVQVWELWLEDDGGPHESKSVRHLLVGGKKS